MEDGDMKPVKYLCVFLFFIVFFGFSSFGGLCDISAAYTWTNEIVDNGGTAYQNDVGSYSSIAVDASGKLHISYMGLNSRTGSLFYASNASGSWVTEILSKRPRIGYHTSLAIDSSGNAHISHLDISDRGHRLMYTTNATGKWVMQTVASFGDASGSTSIALDSSDNVHISYSTSHK
jgi:hypothetical protein